MTEAEIKRLQRRLGVTPDGDAGLVTHTHLFLMMAGKPLANAAAFGRGALKHFPAYEITTPLRLAHFMAQIHVESQGYTKLVENLNYSAERMAVVWPSRYAIDPRAKVKKPNALAKSLAHNPEALANNVYAGRMGNVNKGDGWKNRGRSLKMITGAENYAKCEARTGIPLRANPDLAADPEHSVHIACDYWGAHCLNTLADRDDIEGITHKINGGLIGINDRKAQLVRAKLLLL